MSQQRSPYNQNTCFFLRGHDPLTHAHRARRLTAVGHIFCECRHCQCPVTVVHVVFCRVCSVRVLCALCGYWYFLFFFWWTCRPRVCRMRVVLARSPSGWLCKTCPWMLLSKCCKMLQNRLLALCEASRDQERRMPRVPLTSCVFSCTPRLWVSGRDVCESSIGWVMSGLGFTYPPHPATTLHAPSLLPLLRLHISPPPFLPTSSFPTHPWLCDFTRNCTAIHITFFVVLVA